MRYFPRIIRYQTFILYEMIYHKDLFMYVHLFIFPGPMKINKFYRNVAKLCSIPLSSWKSSTPPKTVKTISNSNQRGILFFEWFLLRELKIQPMKLLMIYEKYNELTGEKSLRSIQSKKKQCDQIKDDNENGEKK